MIVLTESEQFANQLLDVESEWRQPPVDTGEQGINQLIEKLFADRPVYSAELQVDGRFDYMLIAEKAEQSQYDIAIDLCRQGVSLPDRTICLAGSGANFHGQRNRSWSSPDGNIYITAIFAPNREIKRFGPGFVMLPAVAVVEACDAIPGIEGRAFRNIRKEFSEDLIDKGIRKWEGAVCTDP